jgi:SEC-C motif domain protein
VLHRGERQAATPEELMRSRYSAYALGDLGYVDRTWHPRTRPDAITPRPGLRWTGLEVHAAAGEVVEFTATYDGPSGPGTLHEVSRFERRARRWWYVDGDAD